MSYSRLASTVSALALMLLALLTGNAGAQPMPQTQLSAADAAIVAGYMGLCQCLSDRSTLHLERCVPGAQACQNSCASTRYAFVPMIDTIRECRAQELYVVLPNADGRPGSGAIAVEKGSASTLLDRPYAAAAAFGARSPSGVLVGAAEIGTIFGRALRARPILPSHFLLHFPLGGVMPLPESLPEYQKILADIRRRPVYEIEVIGFTDTVADPGFNRRLGTDRAEEVRRMLIRDGAGERNISVASRGKLDLLVPTPDQVAEPRNRRVEVTVR
jgi:outer membrane protein OmpA-like peptidoglycan-associated protein